MSLLCPHLIHLWRPWQGIGKSPRRQVALKRHSTQGTEISLDDIDAEFARDNHCLTLWPFSDSMASFPRINALDEDQVGGVLPVLLWQSWKLS